MRRKRKKKRKLPPPEVRHAISSSGGRKYWDALSPEERSIESRRRAFLRERERRAKVKAKIEAGLLAMAKAT